jgi:hypothetical protein
MATYFSIYELVHCYLANWFQRILARLSEANPEAARSCFSNIYDNMNEWYVFQMFRSAPQEVDKLVASNFRTLLRIGASKQIQARSVCLNFRTLLRIRASKQIRVRDVSFGSDFSLAPVVPKKRMMSSPCGVRKRSKQDNHWSTTTKTEWCGFNRSSRRCCLSEGRVCKSVLPIKPSPDESSASKNTSAHGN